ncbi:glycosyltransferase family 4 protein [Collinsella provencensis]|uniref:glycosyltransferase family 4 protein n=1 Tax=Collinsella provencensis TaxID=1937461 RepID=UPI000C84C2D9
MSSYCICSAFYLPHMGGVERFTDNLALELVRQGHSVTIVTNDTYDIGLHEILSSGVEVYRLPCIAALYGRFPIPKKNKVFRRALAELNARSFDGILINTRFYPHTLIALRFAKRIGVTPIVLDHGSAYLTFGNPVFDVFAHTYEHAITMLVKKYSPLFYGISQKSVEWLEVFGITAKGVISNSINSIEYRGQASNRSFRDELGIDNGRMLLAFTGRLIPEKGIDTLLGMMELLQDEPVDLVIAGEGPLRTHIEKSGLKHLHLVGRLGQPDIAALLLEADLFCLPTRSEGFSTSLLESAACGTPFLVTNVGGARELAPSRDYGFVVKSADSKVFAEKVLFALKEDVDLEAMGALCRSRVEDKYSVSSVVTTLIDAFSVSSAPNASHQMN